MPANSLRPMETRNNVIPHRHTETRAERTFYSLQEIQRQRTQLTTTF